VKWFVSPGQIAFLQTVAVENVFVESKIYHGNWQNAQLTIALI